MEPGVDTGAIAYEARFDLSESDTGLSVSARCVREGVPLIERLLETAAADPAAIPRRSRTSPAAATTSGRTSRTTGGSTGRGRRRRIVDLVRAADYFPFPSPWGSPTTRLGDVELGSAQGVADR